MKGIQTFYTLASEAGEVDSQFDVTSQETNALSLTTAMGSLLRVAARLNFLTWVLCSMALANSFRVGMGTFWKKGRKKSNE